MLYYMRQLAVIFALTIFFGCTSSHSPIPEIARDRVDFIPVETDPLLNTITGRVKFRIAHHQMLARKNVAVFEEKGLCYLRGSVGSKTERAIADRVARDTVGVTEVKNELIISGSHADLPIPSRITDADIEKIVMNTFFISKTLKDAALSVEVKEGKVKIYGANTRPDLASVARELVKNVIGVVSVET